MNAKDQIKALSDTVSHLEKAKAVLESLWTKGIAIDDQFHSLRNTIDGLNLRIRETKSVINAPQPGTVVDTVPAEAKLPRAEKVPEFKTPKSDIPIPMTPQPGAANAPMAPPGGAA